MKKTTKNLSLILASSMLLNQTALAASSDRGIDSLDLDISAADVAEAKKTVADLQAMANQISQLRNDLITKLNTEEKDPYIKVINFFQVSLLIINSSSVLSHLKSTERQNVVMVTTALSGVIDMILRHIKNGKNLTPADVQGMIHETTTNLLANSKPSKELTQALEDLSNLSNDISKNDSILAKKVNSAAGMSDYVAVGTLAYAILHIVAPKLAKEGDEVAKVFLPKLQDISNKVLTSTKNTMVGSNMTSNTLSAIGMVAGYSSEEAQQLIQQILTNLTKTQASLAQQISTAQSGK